MIPPSLPFTFKRGASPSFPLFAASVIFDAASYTSFSRPCLGWDVSTCAISSSFADGTIVLLSVALDSDPESARADTAMCLALDLTACAGLAPALSLLVELSRY